jgi:heme exporter protein C
VLRGAIENPELRARYSAVLAFLGAILVPFIHLSVYLFRTLHPQPILIKPSAPSMPGDMVETMMISLGAFVLLFAWLLHERYLLAVEREHASVALEQDDALVASPAIAGRGA